MKMKEINNFTSNVYYRTKGKFVSKEKYDLYVKGLKSENNTGNNK